MKLKVTGGKKDHLLQAILVLEGPDVVLFRLGWGFDEDLPLRPWPAFHKSRLDRNTHYVDRCLAFCGFYVGMSRVE